MRIAKLMLLAALLAAEALPLLDDMAFMVGDWEGSAGRAAIEEHWLPAKGGRMLGLSHTVAHDRMVGFEFLRIESRPEGVFYVAQPNGRPPVDFKLTRSSKSEAVFENPAHEHPKIISYRREGDALTAKIEGDEKGKHVVQEFPFHLMPARK
jgi:hypothetical protein